MDLTPHVDRVARQLAQTADAGGEEARAVVERLAVPLEATLRLALLEVLSAAADEITREAAPGAVELRLRGGEPEWVVTLAPGEPAPAAETAPPPPPPEGDDGATARISLRLPEHLKAGAEAAAARDGLSLNAWLVRAVAGAVGGTGGHPGPGPATRRPHMGGLGDAVKGWAR